MAAIPPELREKADQAKAGRKTSAKVRTLLDWFGAQRRRQSIVGVIRNALTEADVRTEPDFEHAYIDERVVFVAIGSSGSETIRENEKLIRLSEAGSPAIPMTATPFLGDPTYRIGKLPSANKIPMSVKPDDPIKQAVTLMLHYDFSQLPVMTGPRDVKGMISWRSLGSRLALGKSAVRALDCTESHHELGSDTSLFDAIPTIIRRDAVLIRDHTNAVCGIVTAADVCTQFRQLTEPFLLLNEVEDHIRDLISPAFSVTELETAREPANPRPVKRAADLTLGEYQRLLENPEHFTRLGLDISRSVFCDSLRRVLSIRNDVMHFDPDGLDDREIDELKSFVAFLQRLHAIRQ